MKVSPVILRTVWHKSNMNCWILNRSHADTPTIQEHHQQTPLLISGNDKPTLDDSHLLKWIYNKRVFIFATSLWFPVSPNSNEEMIFRKSITETFPAEWLYHEFMCGTVFLLLPSVVRWGSWGRRKGREGKGRVGKGREGEQTSLRVSKSDYARDQRFYQRINPYENLWMGRLGSSKNLPAWWYADTWIEETSLEKLTGLLEELKRPSC